jgi:integrase
MRKIQEILGHKNMETTMIYTRVINQGGKRVRSPADFFVYVAKMSNIYKELNKEKI